MHGSFVPVCAAALAVCWGQATSELSPELRTLARIKVHMRATLERQPNYTCVEEIERSRRRAPRNRYELVDMVRLEVALVNRREMFSWPGQDEFTETELQEFVPAGGAIGNGQFAIFAHNIFFSNVPIFTYGGLVDWKGGKAHSYSYRVPQMLSGYQLKVNNRAATVGYHGSFIADPTTLDLQQLEVIADDIPFALGLRSATSRIEYARARIGDSEYLLPASSDLIMAHIGGDEDRNRIQFSACRQYTGQSVLKFSEGPADSPAPATAIAAKPALDVPAGLSFDVALDADIDSDSSMIGDVVTATLRENIRYNKKGLFAKGAKLTGRILRLERHTDHCVVDIRFSRIESETHQGILAANLEESAPLLRGARQEFVERSPHPVDSGALTFKGGRIRLPKGLRIRIKTEAVASASSR